MSGEFEPGTLSRSAQHIAFECARLAQQKKARARQRKRAPSAHHLGPALGDSSGAALGFPTALVLGHRSRATWGRGSPDSPSRKSLSPTQQTGLDFEQRAARYLEAAGLTLIARNCQVRTGEIDLIALDQSVLVFIEVRARASATFGGAAASVTPTKQKRIARAAATLLPTLTRHLNRIGVWQRQGACRFDVVAFEASRLYWLRDAFVLTVCK